MMRATIVWVFALLGTTVHADRQIIMAAKRAALHRTAPDDFLNRVAHGPAAAALSSPTVHHAGRRLLSVNPADHGGDPTGVKDSQSRFRRTLWRCIAQL